MLLGVVDLRELVLAQDDALLGDLMVAPVVAAEADDSATTWKNCSPSTTTAWSRWSTKRTTCWA